MVNCLSWEANFDKSRCKHFKQTTMNNLVQEVAKLTEQHEAGQKRIVELKEYIERLGGDPEGPLYFDGVPWYRGGIIDLRESVTLEIKHCQDGLVTWERGLKNVLILIEDSMKGPKKPKSNLT